MNRVIVVVLSALAATRLMRAWLFEQVGEPFREPLVEWLEQPVIDNGVVDLRATSAKNWAYDLVTCPHCLGFWTTFVFILAWPFRPARRLIEALAGAMLLSWFVDTYPAFNPDED